MLGCMWLLLCVATWIVRGAPPVPSRAHQNHVNMSYYNRLAKNPTTTLLLPMELQLESSETGSGAEEMCADGNLQQHIEALRQISSRCVHRVAFQNCCEPKYLGHSWLKSTVYPIQINDPFELSRFAYCDQETDGGGWMVIMRRGYKKKFRSFFHTTSYRKYERGFGKVDRDFWMGLKAVQYFTNQEGVELLVEVNRGNRMYAARYNNFTLGDRSTGYAIEVGGYWENSTLPDSLSYSNGVPFQTNTKDQCFQYLSGPWWYPKVYSEAANCSRVNLFRSKSVASCKKDIPSRAIHDCLPIGPMWEMDGEVDSIETVNYLEVKIRPKTWACGMQLYSEYELKKAYLYP